MVTVHGGRWREIHQRGHHWHRFPPDRYVETGPVERIPVFPASPYALCGATRPRWLAWLGQVVAHLYAFAGGRAWCAAVTVGVMATDLGVRAVHARIVLRREQLLLPRHALIALPAFACFAFPSLVRPTACTILAAATALLCFAFTWWRALPEFLALDAVRNGRAR